VEGAEPTNNLAERQLRPAVLWRKVSFGSDSPRGSRFGERIMSVVSELRRQKMRVLDYLAEQFAAFRKGLHMVSILPPLPEPHAASP
jgi:transposase